MPKFFINISRGYKMHDYYDIAYKNLFEKQAIKTIVFFDRNLSDECIVEMESDYCKILFYDSKSDLLEQLTKIDKNDIYFINTFEEVLVPLLHEIRITLWYVVSTEHVSYRNKHIQREILSEKFPETTVNFFEVDIKKQNIEEYYNKLDFPYIIKPTSWVQSSGVWIIKNKMDLEYYIKNEEILSKNMLSRWIENNIFLIEEFIEGEMYTILYFVDNDWNISYTPFVNVKSSQNIWIDDFSNYVRLLWKVNDNNLSFDELKSFVEKQVLAFGIRNTYISQDFKKNTNWVLKSIELNARIWWYRLEMMQNNYDYNLLEMPLWNSLNLDSSFSKAVFVFYPSEIWVLKWFNEELLNHFKNLNSYTSIRISRQKIWKTVWLTKDWFWSLAAIRLKNDNLEQFKKDYKFVEDNYNNLIVLE